jgi:2,3-bisphosphoglycerate-independent phosphoglycerate mutase
MDVRDVPGSDQEALEITERLHHEYDFTFVHFKATDARGEDGDFDAKVAAAEAVDLLIPDFRACGHDVVIVTGDHSTPATYGAHSWHAVPVLVASRWARPTGGSFGEASCRSGDLGQFHGKHLMSLALAHAGRLAKFGA